MLVCVCVLVLPDASVAVDAVVTGVTLPAALLAALLVALVLLGYGVARRDILAWVGVLWLGLR